MHLNQSIFTLSLLTILCSTSSLLSAREHKPATIKPMYAPETMYRVTAIIESTKAKVDDAQITKLQIATFPLFVDLQKKYFAGFRGSNEKPKQACTNTSLTLQSISLNTYLNTNQITTKQWKQAYPYDTEMNRSVTLVKTNCKIPFFREFIFDTPKEKIESGGEYGPILINQSNVFFMGTKPVPFILPSH